MLSRQLNKEVSARLSIIIKRHKHCTVRLLRKGFDSKLDLGAAMKCKSSGREAERLREATEHP